MNFINRKPKTLDRILAGLTMFSLVMSLSYGTFGAFVAEATVSPKVDICHATASDTNPYNSQSVDMNATAQGHDDHDGGVYPASPWGDIIPPYEYQEWEVVGSHMECPNGYPIPSIMNSDYCRKDKMFPDWPKDFSLKVTVDDYGMVTHQYPGKNWDTAGQAVWNNKCVVEPSTASIKILKATNDASGSAIQFDFTGTLGAFDVLGDGTDNALYENLTPGTYTITETPETGWVFDSVICTGQTFSQYSSAGGVELRVNAGDNAICTFTNNIEVLGCTDSEASNYNRLANKEDNSCIYPLKAPAITLDEVTIDTCGTQNVTLNGNVAFSNPTSQDEVVFYLDDTVVLADTAMDDEYGPDGATYAWARALTNVAPGAHTVKVVMFDDVGTRTIVRAQTEEIEFEIEACPVINTCLIPSAIGDDEKFKVGKTEETPLQTILTGAGYSVDVNNDQKNYQVWDFGTPGTDYVTFNVKILAKNAGNTQTFGYYKAGDGSTFVPVFSIPPSAVGNTFAVNIDSSFLASVGFAIQTTPTEPNTWYSQISMNADSKDHVAVYNPSVNTYVLAFEDLSKGDNDYNDLVVEITSVTCVPEEVQKMCTIVSDTQTLVEGDASTLTWVHPSWTTALNAGTAKWIWDDTQAPATGETLTFTRDFNVDSAPTGSTLKISADNRYTVSLNGNPLTCDGTGSTNYLGIDTCSAPVVSGVNTLAFEVTNDWYNTTNPQENPGALIYELTIDGSSCSPVPEENTETIKMCKINASQEARMGGWDMILSNGKSTTTYTTLPETGCVSAEVNPDDGPWTVKEVNKPNWDLVDVFYENGSYVYADESENKIGCTFFGKQEPTVVSVERLFASELMVAKPEYVCTFVNEEGPYGECLTDENLLVNGSFEDPILESSWELITSPLGWVVKKVADTVDTVLEFHRGLFGNEAADGAQYVELGGNEATYITQSVATDEGDEYKLFWAFAPRQDTTDVENMLAVLLNGSSIATEGPTAGIGELDADDWKQSSYAFTAGANTEVTFKDTGTGPLASYGTFVDAAYLCKVKDNTPDDGDDDGDGDGGDGGTCTNCGRTQGSSSSRDRNDTDEDEDEQLGEVQGAQTTKVPTVAGASTGAGGTSPSPYSTMPLMALATMYASVTILRRTKGNEM